MENSKLLINNQWTDSENGQTLEVISPWDLAPMGAMAAATTNDVSRALSAADSAFAKWRRTPVGERVKILRKAATLLNSHQEELAALLSQEIGKTLESAKEEIERSISYLELVTDAARHMRGTVYAGDITGKYERNRKTGYYNREPLGVIVAISPFNYPINLSVTKVGPALMSGNSVVFKPSNQGSLSAVKFYSYFVEAGLPEGVLNIVTGKSSEIGDMLVSAPQVKLIAFTGSTSVGNHIAEITHGIPLLMELGGKDTAIVTAKADINIAADEIVSGAYSYCGQRCTAQKLVLVYQEIADQFVSAVAERARQLELNPMIDTKSADYVMELIADATSKGAVQVVAGNRENNKLQANVLDQVTESMRIFSEEQFGPALPVSRVTSEEDAIGKLNSLKYGLQASVYTQDLEEAFRIADQLEVGTVQINGRPDRGPDNFPFGGVKDSGRFMQGTWETMELMTRGKLTVLNLHKLH